MPPRKKKVADVCSPQVRSKRGRNNIAESPERGKDKKLLQKDGIETTKRTRHSKRTVPVDVLIPQIKRGRKRKNETAATNKSKKLKAQGEKGKTYCWLCHKLAQGQTCACSRVYHNECLEKASKVFKNNKCPECQLKSVDGTKLTKPFTAGLKIYLKSATKYIEDKVEKNKLSWPQNSDVVPASDIETLLKKIRDNSYKTTAAFYADVKWFYHNCCIQYGEHSKQSKDMKLVVKEFKEELVDMEACPECYYHLLCRKRNDDEDSEKAKNSHNEHSFVRLCSPPHDIVWAKVAGHSHWPAKCLKIINGKAHVRFFGKYEKSDVPINTIFHISETHPLYHYRNITNTVTRTSIDYSYAKQQLLNYITLYNKNVGNFQFFEFRVFYEPGNGLSQTETAGEQPTNNDSHKEKTSQIEVISRAYSAALGPPPISASTDVSVEPSETATTSSDNNISVDMTFCVDTRTSEYSPDIGNSTNISLPTTHLHDRENTTEQNMPIESPPFLLTSVSTTSITLSPVSDTQSISTASICSTTNSCDFQIKKELFDVNLPNRISSLAESSDRIPDNFMQILGNALINHSNTSAAGGSTSTTESILSGLLRDFSSERAFSPPISVPVKEENFDGAPSTGEVSQPEKEMNASSTENEATIPAQQLPETEVVSAPSNNEIAVIDLTAEDDNPTMRLSNIFVENPQMHNLYQHAHKAVGTFISRLCEEVCKQQKPEPSQLCKALIKKLDDTEKKFQEETEKLRDEIKRLQRSVDPEK